MKKALNWQEWPVLGHWQVSLDHPVLDGHFPGQPVVPGALLLSWLLQELSRFTGREVAEIRDSRFPGVALPGAHLESRISSSDTSTRFVIIDSSSEPARVVASGSVLLSSLDDAR
ncbi:hypothetical protein [Ottowia thiooxydans]|uniref:hypothetical protein n=1 Tax=Ottowia thiooxydans TaxID=219182 RepID=UPI000405888F|nr:hypothetical protein [Ottowia thiooxydans]